MLKIRELKAGYGSNQILNGVNLDVNAGEIVILIGSNGSGKSTVMKSIVGLTQIRSGTIWLKDRDITGLKTHQIVTQGLGFVPQNNNIFPNLSVEQNLKLGCYLEKKLDQQTLCEVYELFPALEEHAKRNASYLSGGQRQMLAIGRVLMMKSDLLLLDEPAAGLSPKMMNLIFDSIQTVAQTLKKTFLIVEQNVKQALAISDRCYVLAMGSNAHEGDSEAIRKDPKLLGRFLGVQ